ncbi:MAG: hypothetical protein MZV64_11065 [Ignavibacteriales bacterium]|nr:hypothetical protein [Ignavibacteriales bacterium]
MARRPGPTRPSLSRAYHDRRTSSARFLFQAPVDELQPLGALHEALGPRLEPGGQAGGLDRVERLPRLHLLPDIGSRGRQHVAEGLEIGRLREGAMPRDDLRALGQAGQDLVQVMDPALDVAAVGHIHEGEYPVEEHIAHVDDLGPVEEDDGVAVGVGLRVMDQPDGLTARVDDEPVLEGDVRPDVFGKSLGHAAHQRLVPGQDRPDVLVGDDGRARPQGLVPVRMVGVPMGVDEDPDLVPPGQGLDRFPDPVGRAPEHGVDQDQARLIGQHADVAASALQHIDGPGHRHQRSTVGGGCWASSDERKAATASPKC